MSCCGEAIRLMGRWGDLRTALALKSIRQCRLEPRHREAVAGAVGDVSARRIAVAVNPAFWDVVSLLQKTNQFHKRFSLSRRRRRAVEITDKAYPNPLLVSPISRRPAAMCARKLTSPSIRRLDLPVAAIGPVADDEVIADAFPSVLLTVPFIEYSCIAFSRRRMMNYYRRPRPRRPRRQPPSRRWAWQHWRRRRRFSRRHRQWRRLHRRRHRIIINNFRSRLFGCTPCQSNDY